MTRPVGMVILGILSIFAGLSGLLAELDKPVVFFGVLHTGANAFWMHVIPSLLGMYLGFGLLKPLRHIWYVYPLAAVFSMIGLSVNLISDTKIWELYLWLDLQTSSIPRWVKLTRETHYLFIAIYFLTAMYVFRHQQYFWGDDEL